MKIQSITQSLLLCSTIALAFASTQSRAEAAYDTCSYHDRVYDIGKVVFNTSGPGPYYWMLCKKGGPGGGGYYPHWERVKLFGL